MKKILLGFVLTFSFLLLEAQTSDNEYTMLLTGASFASPENGWFEIGARHLNATPLNRAVGGEAIANSANRMIEGTLYSVEELDKIDAFVIMQVHEKDVADLSQIKEDYTDYETPFDRLNYAGAYDYVIKRYMAECYNLKFNKESKYYNSPFGKPAVIVLCTHWHDARIIFNSSIREVAKRWGLPLVEFDKNVGFSKTTVHPITKQQMSTLHANETETTHAVEYGWHQAGGEDKYIQQRMAAIFVDAMRKVLPLK